jgi:alkaline phosphatase D
VTIAVASCQRFQDGTFVAHRHLASRELDLVVFLGDVIYADRGRGDVRPYDERRPTTLDEYRRRHARYRADPDLQACLAAHPWVVTRDDNDVANGWGPDHELRGVAERALAEHHPMRPEDPGDLRRTLAWGDLADLVLLDCRPHRSPPAGRDGPLGATIADAALDAPERTMLGADQEAWLGDLLGASTAAWQLVASQVMVGELGIELGDDRLLNNDQWDGYPAARDRLAAQLGVAPSPLVLAGDLHSGIVDVVRDATGRAVATELVTPSISSAVDESVAAALAAAPLFRPDLLDVRAGTNGWVELDVRRDDLGARVIVLDARDESAEPTVARSLTLRRGEPEPLLDG